MATVSVGTVSVVEDLHGAVAGRLRVIDQRYTSGRRALVDALAAAERPLTTSELVTEGPGLPQSTTYRTLAVLEQAGVVHRVMGSDEFARFELAEELTGRHHHHLVCVRCGSVSDFDAPGRVERSLEAVIAAVSDASGFAPESHRLDVLGTCASCRDGR